jgi:hypothetical protein
VSTYILPVVVYGSTGKANMHSITRTPSMKQQTNWEPVNKGTHAAELGNQLTLRHITDELTQISSDACPFTQKNF